MNEILKIGQIVHTESSQMPCQVEQFLGGGGQGEVYQANLGGQSVALKWYLPHALTADPDQRSRLEAAIESGAPNERFLWPIDLVSEPGIDGFGYIMPLRKPEYKTLVDLMKGKITHNFSSLATAGFQLADSFLQLHSRGLYYCDISFGNVFFNPDSGDILICDNDNVTTNGAEVSIGGTPRFMAPEIVVGQARPSTQTDLYSLAVLLFYMLFIHHPLDGKHEAQIVSLDIPAMNKLYGSEALFIFDPENRANEPLPGYHDNAIVFWQIYPQFLRDLFIKAFTSGIRDPQNGRVRESEWRGAMVRMRDSIVYCPHCGQKNFYDADFIKQSGGKMKPCCAPDCQKEIRLPPRMRIDKNIIMLNHDSQLFPHHINTQLFDFSHPIAEVSRHPTNPQLWGIKNLGREKWVCTTAAGELKEVEPNRSIPMSEGTKINFGKTEGEIRV
jgi:eukaryotic-like serine/threonine-protein kinase